MYDFYYLNKYGHYIDASRIQDAYLYITGKYFKDDYKDYIQFINYIWGKHIIKACRPTVNDLICSGQKVSAIKLYKQQNNCSLLEAKNYIDSLIYSN